MRNRALHDALRDFALEAASVLEGELRSGAEIQFEVLEEHGRRATLYQYRPLTAEFIAERWPKLRAMPTCVAAAAALGQGAATYLRTQGLPGLDAEPALQAMLERLYDEASSFVFPEDRFERLYADVERSLYADMLRAFVAAPVLGLQIEADRVDLGGGLSLVRRHAVELPSDAWLGHAAGEQGGEVALVLTREISPAQPLPTGEAIARFRTVQRALRLFKHGAVALAPLAYGRTETGPWQPSSLGSPGTLRGEPWVLFEGEEAELRELLAVLDGGHQAGRVDWALRRFEMGCERSLDTEALSDYLLALRGLLDGVDDAGRASLSLRVAALCAEEDERRALQRRVELAVALERFLTSGGSGEAYVDTIGSESPRMLVLDIEEQLRAMLRDVVCGFLDQDLKSSADDILLASGEPMEIKVRDMRRERRARPRPEAAEPVEPEPEPEPQPEPLPEPEPEPVPATRRFHNPQADSEDEDVGVTPSADWGFDEDPESYSAPV